MKLRKKIIALSLTVMSAISASLSISSNAASNHADTYHTVTMSPGSENCQAWLPNWRKKLNDSYVYLKVSNLNRYDRNKRKYVPQTVEVLVEGGKNESGLWISDWNTYTYSGTLNWPNYDCVNRGKRAYTVGNGQYLLWNLVYEQCNRANPANLVFGSTDGYDYNFNVTWSPDSIGSYTIIDSWY